jgi:hypothetical protein
VLTTTPPPPAPQKSNGYQINEIQFKTEDNSNKVLILKYKKPDETADNEIKEEKIKEKKKKKKKKLLESRDENGKVLKKKKKKKKKNKDMVTNNDQPVDKPTGRIDLKRKCDFDEDEPAS